MFSDSQLFWQASLEELKKGYVYHQESEQFVCLICGKCFTNGIIYSDDETMYEAQKYIQVHIQKNHGSTFDFLINLDKKFTGLTEHQKAILEYFYQGNNDKEVAKKLNTGSTSTIRNHRFTLREKQKQAKVFLAIMELLHEQMPKKHAFIEIPRSLKKVDERFAITREESEKILSLYFKHGLDGRLETFPLKEKKRVAILKHLLKDFAHNKTYTEKEVNDILKKYYDDYVLLRRLLIDYGFMDRSQDGNSYWVKL